MSANNTQSQEQQIILMLNYIYRLFLCLFILSFTEQLYRKFHNCKVVMLEIYDAVEQTLDIMNRGYYITDDDNTALEIVTEKEEEEPKKKEEIRYELKYFDEMKQLRNEFTLSWSHFYLRDEKMNEILEAKRKEIKETLSKLNAEVLQKGLEYLDIDDLAEGAEYKKAQLYAEIEHMKSHQIRTLEEKLTSATLENEAKGEAYQFIKNQFLDGLKNSFIIEKTPLGNVLMYYNNSRESFEYYSDNTIPYRYLETVSRKYVKTFNCRYLYVDMGEEISLAERKLKEIIEKKAIEEEESKKQKENQVVLKKNVFTKFKSYNKESGTGRVNTGAPPKNSIPNNNTINSKRNDNPNIILKDNANRYTCEGRMSNFNFLKKTKREVVDKKYAMSFADFKKIKHEENKTL